MFATLWVMVFILIGALLPPGFVDPDTGGVRFVSDAFEDYRALPILNLPALLILVCIYWIFATQVCLHTTNLGPTVYPTIILATGITGIAGFVVVTVIPTGNVHILGAFVFMSMYIFMQYIFDLVIDRVYKGNRMVEYGLPVITVVAMGFFGAFLVVSLLFSEPFNYARSVSAGFEYIVFILFICLNVYGVSTMAYICRWYETDDGTWVKKMGYKKDDSVHIVIVPEGTPDTLTVKELKIPFHM